MLAILTAFAVSVCATAVLIHAATAIGLIVRPSEDRWHKAPVPTAGGVAIVTGLGTGLVALAHMTDKTALGGELLFPAIIAAAAVGFVDDAAVLRPGTKLGLEVLVAVFLAAVGPKFSFTSVTFGWVLTVFWLVTTMNAVNLIDGIDGLAGCLSAISAVAIGIIAALHGGSSAVIWSLTLAASIFGFLLFNKGPARIFMGDTGALSIGASLGVLSIQVSNIAEISAFTRLVIPLLLVMVPVLDMLSVTVIRIAHGQPVSHRGLDHAHHRLGRLGLSDSRIVGLLSALQAVACLSAVGLSVAPNELVVPATPFVALPFALVALFLTDQSFEAEGPAVLEDLPLVARLLLNAGYKRRVVDFGLDMVLVAAAYFGAFLLRLNFELMPATLASLLHSLPIVVPTAMLALFVTRIYRGIWRYTAAADAVRFTAGAALSSVLLFLTARVVPIAYDPGVGVIFGLLLFILLGLSRLSFHFFYRVVRVLGPSSSRVVVVGADFAASEAAHHLLFDPRLRGTLVGFVDDDGMKLGKLIQGSKVLGKVADLDEIFEKRPFDELLIASSSVGLETMTTLCEFARRRSVAMYRFLGIARLEGSAAAELGVDQHPPTESKGADGQVGRIYRSGPASAG